MIDDTLRHTFPNILDKKTAFQLVHLLSHCMNGSVCFDRFKIFVVEPTSFGGIPVAINTKVLDICTEGEGLRIPAKEVCSSRSGIGMEIMPAPPGHFRMDMEHLMRADMPSS
jgi:hypothetical protein